MVVVAVRTHLTGFAYMESNTGPPSNPRVPHSLRLRPCVYSKTRGFKMRRVTSFAAAMLILGISCGNLESYNQDNYVDLATGCNDPRLLKYCATQNRDA